MDEVPRETALATPASAASVFVGERLAIAERFADALATDGVERGLIGPREGPRLWERHLLNCAMLADEVPHASTMCDIGSGAGLPGLVVAIARPDLTVTLVEPLLRRATFLSEVVEALGVDGSVEVVRARAEELHGSRSWDVVTSRAVAPLLRLVGWSMPLVSARGAMMAMKGSSAEEEIAQAATEWPTALARPRVVELERAAIGLHTRAVRVEWADPTQVGWPSRAHPVLTPRTGQRSGQRGTREGGARSRRRRPRS